MVTRILKMAVLLSGLLLSGSAADLYLGEAYPPAPPPPPPAPVRVEIIPVAPPPRVEVIPVRPSYQHYWAPGRWDWRRERHEHVWVPGHWYRRG